MTGLNDKTVVLVGPFGLLVQNLISRLTEHGASVTVITDDLKAAQRVCQNIMDMREVSEKFGRTAALELKVVDKKSAENAFSRSAELFGGTDVYIDTNLFSLNIPFFKNEKIDAIDEKFNATFEKIKLLSNAAATFLKSRTRGRILYIFNELDLRSAEKLNSDVFNKFSEYVGNMSHELAAQNTAVNALAVGPNEEYLLSRFGKKLTIQQSMQELKKSMLHAKLVDYNDISNMVTFIASPLSSGLSGQVVHFNHGL